MRAGGDPGGLRALSSCDVKMILYLWRAGGDPGGLRVLSSHDVKWSCTCGAQVVTLAVYVYFLTALIGDQTLIDRSGEAMAHVWFPVFTRDGTVLTKGGEGLSHK